MFSIHSQLKGDTRFTITDVDEACACASLITHYRRRVTSLGSTAACIMCCVTLIW